VFIYTLSAALCISNLCLISSKPGSLYTAWGPTYVCSHCNQVSNLTMMTEHKFCNYTLTNSFTNVWENGAMPFNSVYVYLLQERKNEKRCRNGVPKSTQTRKDKSDGKYTKPYPSQHLFTKE